MKISKPLTDATGELRNDLTDAELASFRPTHEVLPGDLQALLGVRRRGPQKAPTKVATTVRLSPEVVHHFKAGGRGWQTRLDEALKLFIVEHPSFR
ncbi:BrnA antitoxin family protein [Bacillus sp. NP157]|nr:BrnA antitoxin family protein [Bacillus sp. NP157]